MELVIAFFAVCFVGWLFFLIIGTFLGGFVTRWIGLETKKEARKKNFWFIVIQIVLQIVALVILAWQFRLI